MTGRLDIDGESPTPVETAEDSAVRSIAAARGDGLPERLEYCAGARVGRYVIMATVGRGGMGVVYAAWDPKLDRRVALKLVGLDTNAEVQRGRLLREGQALARLDHPNVVKVHDVGIHEDQVYIAMEFIEGRSLRRWLRARRRSLAEVLDVFLAAGRGLAAAHQGGLVHRDVKPDNVLIADDGRVKVVDFGLARDEDITGTGSRARAWAESEPAVARAIERATSDHFRVAGGPDTPQPRAQVESSAGLEAESGPSSAVSTLVSSEGNLTAAGKVLGTPAYMAPEQHARARVDHRSDQYGFCVSLWEAVYGKRPFSGSTTTKLARRKRELQIRESSRGLRVPKWLRAAMLRGLNPRPRRRYAKLDELLTEVEAGLERRRRWRAPAWGFAGFTLVSALVWGLAIAPEGPEPCAAPVERLDGIWDAQRQQAISASFAASELAYAEDSSARIIDALDRYASGWLAAEVEVCEVRRRGEHDEDGLEARLVCLDDRLRRLSSLSAELEIGARDGTTIERATRAVASLPPIAACADQNHTTDIPLPSEPQLRLAVARELERLAVARSDLELGRAEPGVEQARAVANAGEVLGWPPLEAEALFLIATIGAAHEGDPEVQTRDLHAAAEAALEAEQPGLLVRTWAALSRVRLGAGDEQEAQRWLGYAERLAEREHLDADPRVAAALIHCRERLAFGAEDFARAEDHVRRRLGLLRAYYGPDSLQAAEATNSLGVTVYMQHRKDDAIAAYREALAILERVHGPDHPSLAHMHNNIGVVSTDRAVWDRAEHHYLRALAIREANYPPDHAYVLGSLTNLANLYLFSANYGAGLESAAAVVERRGELLVRDRERARERGASATELARLEVELVPDHLRYGRLLAGAERHAEAIVELERGLASLDASPVAQAAQLDGCRVDLLTALARSQRAGGEVEAAEASEAARAALPVDDSEYLRRCTDDTNRWLREPT